MRALDRETLSKALDSLKNTEIGILEKDIMHLPSEVNVLVVGLGGMGIKTLVRLKHDLIKRVGNINEKQVAFLSIDTDMMDINRVVEANELERHETFPLQASPFSFRQILRADDPILPLSIRDIVDEREGFRSTVDGYSAGQNRLSGRITIMDPNNRERLEQAVLEKLTKFQSFILRDFHIYVVAGIGGGTGSGLCIDVPYLLRDVATSKAGIPESKVKVFGHIYLPNAYGMNYASAVNNRNGYAALKEIDYYMNINELGETYRAVLQNGEIVSGHNIFNSCTLIGGKSYNKSMFFEDPKEAAIKTCVHSLINKFTLTTETQARDGHPLSLGVFSEMADEINIPVHLNFIINDPYNAAHFTSGNASYKYSCIGAGAVTFPAEAIADQYIGSIFDKVWARWESNANNVTAKDIDDFEKDLAAPEDLIKKAVQQFENQFDEEMATFHFNRGTIFNFEHLVPCIMDRVIKTFYVDIERTLDLIREKAKKVFTDPDKGPLMLAKILYDNDTTDGYLKRVESYASVCETLINSLYDEASYCGQRVNFSRDNLSRVFGFRRNLDLYCENLKHLYVIKLKQCLFEKLAKDYYKRNTDVTGAYRRIEKMLREDFVSYIETLEYIHDILAENSKSGASALKAKTSDSDSILCISDPSLEKLKETLTDSIRKKIDDFDSAKMAEFIGNLTGDMLDENHCEDWVIREEDTISKCAKTFRRFIKTYQDEDFQSVMNSTFATYMDEAYSLSTVDEKTAAVKAIVDHLDKTSAPMFNTWKGTELDDLGSLRYSIMLLPSAMGQWASIFANVFPPAMMHNAFYNTDQNTIYRYTVYSRLPLWLHADIADYERDYNEHYMTMGLHINESSKANYRKFPSLFIPEQWWRYEEVRHTEYVDKNELKHRADIRRVFDKALKLGVIQKSGSSYDIQVIGDVDKKPTEEQLDQFIMNYVTYPSNLSEDGMCKAGSHLISKMQEQFGTKKITIQPYQIGFQQYPANNDEEAFLLLRRQMSRVKILEKEIKYFKEVCERMEEIIVK